MEVDIVKYIPFGRENAIGRTELAMKVGCSDRTMRDLINTARKKRGNCKYSKWIWILSSY